MSMIDGLERPVPVPFDWAKPFWDAANEKKLVVQHCGPCDLNIYPLKINVMNAILLNPWAGKRLKVKVISMFIWLLKIQELRDLEAHSQ